MNAEPAPTASAADAPAGGQALAQALQQVLTPLARLALARGVGLTSLEAMLRRAMVEAADAELAQRSALPPHRRVSRISTATGLNRREVTRLVEELRAGPRPQATVASPASELFTRWRSDARWHDAAGQPAELPRQAVPEGGLSFEALARSITQDVHPRSLLSELLRLGAVVHDPATDRVRLARLGFVPQGDAARMVAVLGRNVGAHFEAAVDNVLATPLAPAAASGATGAQAARQGDGSALPPASPHLEQALFATGLSAASLAEFRSLVQAEWQRLVQAVVPALEAMVARDETAPGPRHSVRLGLYGHHRPQTPAGPGAAAALAQGEAAPPLPPQLHPPAAGPDPRPHPAAAPAPSPAPHSSSSGARPARRSPRGRA